MASTTRPTLDPLARHSHYICKHCTSSLRLSNGPARFIHSVAFTAAPTQAVTRRNGRGLPPAPTHERVNIGSQWRAASSAAPRLASSSSQKPTVKKVATAASANTPKSKNEKSFWENDWTIFSADNAALVKKAQAFGDKVLQAKGVPDDAVVIEAMKVVEFAAAQLTRAPTKSAVPLSELAGKRKKKEGPLQISQEGDATDGLLSLDRSKNSKAAHPMSISISMDLLSNLAYKIITFPTVFVTPEVLSSYVKVQSLLKRPETFPEIFHLYSNKPIPTPNTNPTKYSTPNPQSHKQAIPKDAADSALQAAIEKKDLELAIAIIDTSYATKAFQRHKFITKAFPAIGGIALTPAAAGILASQLPAYFPIANPSELVAYATVGMVTYVAGVSTLGFVVITTTNDHMERVTWAPGVPLRERWLREEERAAVDKVALAWGFKGERRGEEQGIEWENLREWCGLRGMILDKTELMEGME
ncbi:uncharacterized protein PV09_09402 [Verruconis gallopava]|uniref:Uncharacterized protein n=1 Tax=Verruconis gallopava TaxID=253628 RepID=A0A0D1YDL7_9PEZI|nr:uncharacterized protein PV09_09402 [Verruconis gallopava]KIV98831.1 hypothetical protein PV09_09402 [Verruconis gallopava]